MLPFTLSLSLLIPLHVYIVMYSFASLIDKQLSRKATLMSQDVLLFELFQQTCLILFYFQFYKSTQKYSRQNLPVRKKAYCPLTAPGGAICFFPRPLSNQAAPWSEKQTQPYNKWECIGLVQWSSYLNVVNKKRSISFHDILNPHFNV